MTVVAQRCNVGLQVEMARVNAWIFMGISPYSQLPVSRATWWRPSGVNATASALPPGVRAIVTSPFASSPLRLRLTLPW